MRPAFALCFALAAIAPQRNCNFGSPEQIGQYVQQALQPYFPNTHAVVIRQSHAILAITCTQGISPQFVDKLKAFIASDADMGQQLAKVNLTGLLGYRYFVLGFDGGWIWYDIQNKTVDTRPLPDTYAQQYNQTCGFE